MGREIRRVPAGWQHPTKICKHWTPGYGYGGCVLDGKRGTCYRPLDENYAKDKKKYDDLVAEGGKDKADNYFGQAPDPQWYVPVWPEGTATHYQIYETVSEGTPVSPVFTSLEDMEDWLVNDGGRDGKVSRKAACNFCQSGWAPSMVVTRTGNDVDIKSNVQCAEDFKENDK